MQTEQEMKGKNGSTSEMEVQVHRDDRREQDYITRLVQYNKVCYNKVCYLKYITKLVRYNKVCYLLFSPLGIVVPSQVIHCLSLLLLSSWSISLHISTMDTSNTSV